MNLEQFKKAFDSDLRTRSEQQEKTIKELHQTITSLKETIRALENRCYCLTAGTMCGHCGYRDICQAIERNTQRKQ